MSIPTPEKPDTTIDEHLRLFRDYCEVFLTVDRFFSDLDKARLFMRTRNPLLGGLAPNMMIAHGRIDKLRKFVHNAIDENKPS